MPSTAQRIAQTLSLPVPGVTAALALFDDGATVPFVARYRKERTGDLDEVQLRAISEHSRLLRELDTRRAAILEAIGATGRLTPQLQAALEACTRRSELEDLYQPYKQRRKTRGDQARARGLQPLADRIAAQPRDGHPAREAQRFTGAEVPDAEAALQGARDIVAEQLGRDPELRRRIRQTLGRQGSVVCTAKKGVENPKFRDYVGFRERAATIPSHRYLAVCRGEAEGALTVRVRLERSPVDEVLRSARWRRHSPFGAQLEQAATDATKRLLLPAAERAVRAVLHSEAEAEAIGVFATNLEALLLAPPLGPRPVLGIDPGIRTGCKCAMVAATGALVDHQTLYLVGRKQHDGAKLEALLRRHRPHAVAVGNGTGGREAEAQVREAVRALGADITVVSVSESGASVYSASELAGAELADVDLTVRGAVSIARRLQDPLAELVKVEPRALGVGQYQHDVDARELERRLASVVESCVNRVGVDVNTASPALLEHVAGLGPRLSKAIAARRAAKGPYRRRAELLEVSGLGARTYEQCAGFLRVRGGPEPLDASAVHPERYGLVRRMARDAGVAVDELVGTARVQELRLERYVDGDTGLSTLRDIAAELQRPGRDPREAFATARFRDDVHELSDLQEGMVLEGVVTNVANFGAFVDVGVHTDGLVHISELADRFVRDPHQVVRAGQVLRVRVLSVDVDRKRISLSAKQA